MTVKIECRLYLSGGDVVMLQDKTIGCDDLDDVAGEIENRITEAAHLPLYGVQRIIGEAFVSDVRLTIEHSLSEVRTPAEPAAAPWPGILK